MTDREDSLDSMLKTRDTNLVVKVELMTQHNLRLTLLVISLQTEPVCKAK